MTPRALRLLFLSLFSAAVALSSARADEGRIPIFEPTTITAPGSYFVSRSFSGSAGPAITIQSDDVTIDLAGHVVTQTGAFPVISADGYQGISVHGPGRLAGGTIGVFIQRLLGGGVYSVTSLVSTGQSQAGVKITGDCSCCYLWEVDVRDVLVLSAAGDGIFVNAVDGLSIEGSRVGSAGGRGVYANCVDSLRVAGNEIHSAGSHGIYVGNNGSLVLEGNAVVAVPGTGAQVELSRGGRIAGNAFNGGAGGGPSGLYGLRLQSVSGHHVSENGLHGFGIGIELDSMCTSNQLTHNSVTAGTRGIFVQGRNNAIDGNVLTGNATGLAFDAGATGNVFGGNRAGASYSVTPGNTDAGGNY